MFSTAKPTLIVILIITAFLLVPVFFTSEASTNGDGLIEQTSAADPDLPIYDIRNDKQSYPKRSEFTLTTGKTPAAVADIRDEQAKGADMLRASVPTLKIEYNKGLRIPEVIGPDVKLGRTFLTGPAKGKRSDLLKNFLARNDKLIGLDAAGRDELEVAADYTNPDGNLSFVLLEQKINGIPVFQGEVKAAFTRAGEMVRVINNLAPAVGTSSVSTDFGDPAIAAQSAAENVKAPTNKSGLRMSKGGEDENLVRFVASSPITAEKTYFPIEPGVAVPAWKVMVSSGGNTYYVVTATDGTVLWRKNLTDDQTQSATYNVYANSNSMIDVADDPFPLTPGPLDPSLGTQGAAISRSTRTLIGNEVPYTFNQLGWINDGDNTTAGNNVVAGLDRKLPNTGNPASPNDLDPDGIAIGSPNRTFDYPINPGNPNDGTGDSPLPAGQTPGTCLAQADASLPTDYQKAVVTQLFYLVNRYHDEMYLLGFTEAARNFQNTNFSGQGTAGDRISAQAQDCSGTDNANFTTPSDGGRPTMQMYLWTGPTPDFDGSLDANIVIHEMTHGLSNRLHGNAVGLNSNMSAGMGEGWGDFYALSMLSQPDDPVDGVYAMGGYATRDLGGSFTGNYYYGIRRYPKAIMSVTGGVNNKPHNAYTFSYLNADCNSRLNNSNFAFGRGPGASQTCDQVHNIGEIWSTMLWEVRSKFVSRLGWDDGNRKMLQLVTDGMKLAPLAPTFLQERDAILAAAEASSATPSDDIKDLWEGFAIRGLGVNASIQAIGSGSNNTVVTDGFDLPNLTQSPELAISDAATGNNNGVADPGEMIELTIPLSNTSGITAAGTTLRIGDGPATNYGDIQHDSTGTKTFSYTIPSGAACGSSVTVTLNVNSSLGPVSFEKKISIGTPSTTFTENFDGVTAPALPNGWTVTQIQNGTNFVNTTTNSDSAPNSMFALDPSAVGGGSDLTSPQIPISVEAARLTFRHRFDTENGWDGGLLEISIAGGPFQDIIAAGGSFLQNGYTATLGDNTSGNSPLSNRPAWTGNSNGYITSIVQLPAAAKGQNVQLKWRFGADDNTSGVGPNPGWNIDGISIAGNYNCSAVERKTVRADFDGDGKTDLSFFRSSTRAWWTFGSQTGTRAIAWGLTTDRPLGGDLDGDHKADLINRRDTNDNSKPDIFSYLPQTATYSFISWGIPSDVVTVGNYDSDQEDEFAAYRLGPGFVWIRDGVGSYRFFHFGQTGDLPLAGDFDGDGKSDLVVYRPSEGKWYITSLNGSSIASQTVIKFGLASDKPVPADYDGDGKDDIAIFRPSTSQWWIRNSLNGQINVITFGTATDIPVPGDYDGDFKYDLAFYRNGQWWIRGTTSGIRVRNFGGAGDIPIPSLYISPIPQQP